MEATGKGIKQFYIDFRPLIDNFTEVFIKFALTLSFITMMKFKVTH